MSNVGAWPIDPTTTTGLFRFEVGDVVGTVDPLVPTQATFEFMSDATINALMLAYPAYGMAKARGLMSMASQLIAAAQDIAVDDIKIKTMERAKMMLALAEAFQAASLLEDGANAVAIIALQAATDYRSRFQRDYPMIYAAQGVPQPYGATGF